MPEFAPVINVSTLNGTNGFRLDGATSGDYSGVAVAGAGDVNGDGLADLLVGAPFSNTGGVDRGLAYVVFGAGANPAAQGLAARVAAGTAYRFQGEAAGDLAGYSVRSAGDVNGDGFDDLIIGALFADPDAAAGNRGASYLVFGGTSNFEALDAADGVDDNQIALANLTPARGFRFDGGGNGERSGVSVAGAGDMNGDGFADLIIGAPFANPDAGFENGATYIVFGGTANLSDLDDDDGAADGRIDLAQISLGQGMRLDGATTFGSDRSGFSVARAGDVNGDGFADIIVGAPYADPNGVNNDEGAAYLIFGRGAGFPADLDLASLDGLEGTRLDGVAAFDKAGLAVNSAGDINGDGFGDIVIGAPFADPAGSFSGSAYVVFGKTAWGASLDLASLNGQNGFRLDGIRQFDQTGVSVTAAGDVNGDDFDDLLVGTRSFDRLGASDMGAAFVVFGKAGGFAPVTDLGSLDGNNGFRIEGASALDLLGHGSLGRAGDVNGDGFDDIVVGARYADNGGVGTGSTYIIYGHRAQTAVSRVGTELANRINGGVGGDTLSGLSGNDTLIGWEGADLIDGGSGNDSVDGGAGDDVIEAGSGNDSIDGGTGDDVVTGSDGNDVIDGGADSDYLSGGSGDDTFRASLGDDTVFGGSGSDLIDFVGLSGGVTVNLATRAATLPDLDSSLTFANIERLSGTASADAFTGDARRNVFVGLAGNDVLDGGAGNDTLGGGVGKDTLTGGAGNDVFDFDAITDSTVAGSGRDTVADFSADDVINLVTIDAVEGGANDAFAFIGGAAFSALGQLRVFQQGANTFVEMNTTATLGADMRIELTGLLTLNAADFVL